MRSGIAVVALAFVASGAGASQTTVRSYAVEGAGTLELDVPMRWREEVGWTGGDHRPSLTFRPDVGDAFVATLVVLAPPAEMPEGFGTSSWLRAVVQDSARRSLGLADDADLALEQIGDASAVGWYYSVTDERVPDPPPSGAYRVMTQGASAAGGVVLTATILTQRLTAPELDDAIAMLRTARVTARPPDAWRVPGQVVLSRGREGERYDLDVPEDFERVGSSPLELRDRVTGGLLRIDVRDGASEPRSELRRLERDMDLRVPSGWTLRRRGVETLSGRPAARLAALDDVRDELVDQRAIPLKDAVLTVTWRVGQSHARPAEARLALVLAALRIHPDE